MPPLHPGAHVVLLTEDERDAVYLRRLGLEFRDTVLIVGPDRIRYGLLFRLPFEGSVSEQVLRTGTGAINIDACRVATTESLNGGAYAKEGEDRDTYEVWRYKRLGGAGEFQQPSGRWPANMVFVHAAGCRPEGTRKVRGQAARGLEATPARSALNASIAGISRTGYADEDGMESVPVWDCVEGCFVRALNGQSGLTSSGAMRREVPAYAGTSSVSFLRGQSGPSNQHGDSGGASRFFSQFQSEGELLDWLRKLICPPNGELYGL
jgi:hypothetical protein